jgi:hypothetical protein
MLEDCQIEKAQLKEKLINRERELQQYSAKVSSLSIQQERMQADLGSKLQTASQIIDNKLPFIDSSKK